MLFNDDIHSKLANSYDKFLDIRNRFLRRNPVYPSDNVHIAEEVISSLVFGLMARLSFGFLSQRATTWYVEYENGMVNDPGIICHSWSIHYKSMIREFNVPY